MGIKKTNEAAINGDDGTNNIVPSAGMHFGQVRLSLHAACKDTLHTVSWVRSMQWVIEKVPNYEFLFNLMNYANEERQLLVDGRYIYIYYTDDQYSKCPEHNAGDHWFCYICLGFKRFVPYKNGY